MKRVAILCSNPPDSDARVRRHAESLHRHGYQVCYFYPANPNEGEKSGSQGFEVESVPCRHRFYGPALESDARRLGVRTLLGTACPRIFEATGSVGAQRDDAWAHRYPAIYPRMKPSLRALNFAGYLRERTLNAVFEFPMLRRDGYDATERELREIQWQVNQILQLADNALAWRPEQVLAIDAPMLVAAAAVSLQTEARLVYDAHEIYHAQEAPGVRSDLWVDTWRALERLAGAFVHRSMAVSRGVADYLEQECDIDDCTVVFNAPPWTTHPLGTERQNAHSPLRVSFHGALMPGRGLEILCEAIALCDPSIHLHITGDGGLREDLCRRAQQQDVSGRLHVEPAVPYDQLLSYLDQMDVCVLSYPPTCRNNLVSMPNKFFEGLMAGVPLLAPRRLALAEWVASQGLGWTYEDETPLGLSRAFQSILDGVGRWGTLRSNCLDLARNELNWERQEGAFLAIFDRQ